MRAKEILREKSPLCAGKAGFTRSISLSDFNPKTKGNSGFWSSKSDRTGERGNEEGSLQPLISGPRERHQQRTRCSSVHIMLGERAWFVATKGRSTPSETTTPALKAPGTALEALASPLGVLTS